MAGKKVEIFSTDKPSIICLEINQATSVMPAEQEKQAAMASVDLPPPGTLTLNQHNITGCLADVIDKGISEAVRE